MVKRGQGEKLQVPPFLTHTYSGYLWNRVRRPAPGRGERAHVRLGAGSPRASRTSGEAGQTAREALRCFLPPGLTLPSSQNPRVPQLDGLRLTVHQPQADENTAAPAVSPGERLSSHGSPLIGVTHSVVLPLAPPNLCVEVLTSHCLRLWLCRETGPLKR